MLNKETAFTSVAQLSVIPQSQRLPVRFPLRAHAWVTGSVTGQGAYERPPVSVSPSYQCSLPLFLPPFPLSKNK